MVKGEQNHQKTIDANRSLGKKPSYPIAPKKWPLFTSITNTQNLWRLQEVPLQDQEMTKMGARQCSSETVMIVSTFFRVCAIEIFGAYNVSTILPATKCPETITPMIIDYAVFQVGEGEDKATMFSKCKMSLAKQVSFALLTNSLLAFG